MNKLEKFIPALLVLVLLVSSGYTVIRYYGESLTDLVLRSNPITIADGAGAHPDGLAEYTLTSVAKSTNVITCSDSSGCRFYFGETNAKSGRLLYIINRSTPTVNVIEQAGIREMSGDAALGQYDVIQFMYDNDRWVQIAPAQNN